MSPKLITVDAPKTASTNARLLLRRALKAAGTNFQYGIWLVERVPRKAIARATKLGFKFSILKV